MLNLDVSCPLMLTFDSTSIDIQCIASFTENCLHKVQPTNQWLGFLVRFFFRALLLQMPVTEAVGWFCSLPVASVKVLFASSLVALLVCCNCFQCHCFDVCQCWATIKKKRQDRTLRLICVILHSTVFHPCLSPTVLLYGNCSGYSKYGLIDLLIQMKVVTSM